MRCILSAFAFFAFWSTMAQDEPFTKRVVATGFNSAWEVLYGPNDSLWVTENRSYKIQRVDVATGNKTELLDLKSTDAAINLPATGPQAQGGLMGMAIHPNLFSAEAATRNTKPWVYVVYVYSRESCPGTNTSCVFKTKIVRYRYSGDGLVDPYTILDDLPGSNDHNSGRIVVSPVQESSGGSTQYRLYYTLGDMGAGRGINLTRTQNSLNLDAFEGKVLRLNTEEDGDAGADAWVPDDNPFYDGSAITARDYVYTYGHRNAQGLAWGYNGSTFYLYSSEQMDKTDDEVNIIEAGKSYGWDSVAGYCDGNVNGTRIGQTLSANEQNYCTNNANHSEPLFTLYTATAEEVSTMPEDNSFWKTAALSSIDHYAHGKIPGWNYSVLITPLKEDLVYRLKLNAAGTDVVGDTISYFRGDGNRVRRIRVAPDGIRFFVARDASANENPGSIMEYTYTGAVLSLDTNDQAQRPADLSKLLIYPNPVKNELNIELDRTVALPAYVEIYNLSGVLVRKEETNIRKFKIKMHGIVKGNYIVRIINSYGHTLATKQMIKAD